MCQKRGQNTQYVYEVNGSVLFEFANGFSFQIKYENRLNGVQN